MNKNKIIDKYYELVEDSHDAGTNMAMEDALKHIQQDMGKEASDIARKHVMTHKEIHKLLGKVAKLNIEMSNVSVNIFNTTKKIHLRHARMYLSLVENLLMEAAGEV